MNPVKILYVEDDETLGYLTADNLQLRGFQVIHSRDGGEALQRFREESVDICVLDIMLPKIDGFELAAKIRKLNRHVPIIFLTAKTLAEDKIRGLKIGADDYIVKPFNIEELVLKIRVFLKRARVSEEMKEQYSIGRFEFDYRNMELKDGLDKIVMTQREADLLKLFLDHKNVVLKREFILNELWGDDDYFLGRSLDVFIYRLRKYLSTDNTLSIDNIHSIGFRLKDVPS